MRIAICVKRDIHGLLVARSLATQLNFATLRVFCSVKTRDAEKAIPALREMKLLERDVAIDAFAGPNVRMAGIPHPKDWTVLHDLKAEGGAAQLLNFKPDIIISARFSLIFPQRVIDAVEYGIINVHPGALPEYRGLFAPFWQILNAERELRCAVHMVDRGIDTGPILGLARVSFDPARSLMWHAACLYGAGVQIAATAVTAICQGNVPASVPQPAGGAYFGFPAAEDFAALPVPLATALDYAAILTEAFSPETQRPTTFLTLAKDRIARSVA